MAIVGDELTRGLGRAPGIMQFSSIALAIAGLSTAVAADFVASVSGPTISGEPGIFVGAYSSVWVDTQDGCRNLGSGANEICFDGGRAHFIFSGQPKRCLLRSEGINPSPYSPDDWGFVVMWRETACTW
jgi:hypothetical protein